MLKMKQFNCPFHEAHEIPTLLEPVRMNTLSHDAHEMPKLVRTNRLTNCSRRIAPKEAAGPTGDSVRCVSALLSEDLGLEYALTDREWRSAQAEQTFKLCFLSEQ